MKMPCCFRRPRSRCRASERRSSASARIRRAFLMMPPLWIQESTREPWGRVGTRYPIIAIRTSQVVIIDSGGAMRTVRLSRRAAVSDSPRPSLWGTLRRHRGFSSLRSATKGDRRCHDLGDAVQIKGLRDEVEAPAWSCARASSTSLIDVTTITGISWPTALSTARPSNLPGMFRSSRTTSSGWVRSADQPGKLPRRHRPYCPRVLSFRPDGAVGKTTLLEISAPTSTLHRPNQSLGVVPD
jgi:hypothetical protein